MRRVLFVVLSEKGHVHPFIGPAQELAARGVEVAFYAPCDLSAPLGRAGFTRVFAGSNEAEVGPGCKFAPKMAARLPLLRPLTAGFAPGFTPVAELPW